MIDISKPLEERFFTRRNPYRSLAHKRRLGRKRVIKLIADRSDYRINERSIRLRKKGRKYIEDSDEFLTDPSSKEYQQLIDYLDAADLQLPATPELFFLWGLRR